MFSINIFKGRCFIRNGTPSFLYQWQHYDNDLEFNLVMFQCNLNGAFRWFLTVDEIWIQHEIPESIRHSPEWLGLDESRQNLIMTQPWVAKALASIFECAWHTIYHPSWKRKECHKRSLSSMDRLKKEIDMKRFIWRKKCCFTKIATGSHIPESKGKVEWIELQISPLLLVLNRSVSGRLLLISQLTAAQ